MPSFRPGPFVAPQPDPLWIARLHDRQAAILRLSRGLRAFFTAMSQHGVDDICGAIEELLGKEIAEQLKALTNPVVFRPNPVSPDMLIRAVEERDAVQKQLDALEAFLDDIPKKQAAFIESQMLPPLKARLADAERWIDSLQSQMESADQSPSLPHMPERWRMQHPGEDFFRVLEQPVIIYAVARHDPPGHPGGTEIAEQSDGSLKTFSGEAAAVKAASETGPDWKAVMLILQPLAPVAAAPAEIQTKEENV